MWYGGRVIGTGTPDPAKRNALYFSEVDEPESVPSDQNVITVQENTGDDDEVTGLFSYGASLYCLKERHIYDIHYVSQPQIDATPMLVASRGAFSQRCMKAMGGDLYVMDQYGPYLFAGRSVEPIGAPVEILFRDGTVDMTKGKWFFVSCDPERRLVYFHVCLTADSSTRPKAALVYSANTQTWSLDKYPQELGGGGNTRIGGRARHLVGGTSIMVSAEGTVDPSSTAIAWSHTSPLFQMPRTEKWEKRSLRLAFNPTSSTDTLNVALYQDHQSTAMTFIAPYDAGTGVTIASGASAAVVNLQAIQNPYGTTPGFKELSFGGLLDDRGQGLHWISIALSGSQSADQITLYPYSIDGFTPG
jgi:hypothetical protein